MSGHGDIQERYLPYQMLVHMDIIRDSRGREYLIPKIQEQITYVFPDGIEVNGTGWAHQFDMLNKLGPSYRVVPVLVDELGVKRGFSICRKYKKITPSFERGIRN